LYTPSHDRKISRRGRGECFFHFALCPLYQKKKKKAMREREREKRRRGSREKDKRVEDVAL
jgi:hypothetical protein